MDVELMEAKGYMQQKEAREKFQEYRRAVADGGTRGDKILMTAYQALCKGKRVINVEAAIVGAGFNLQDLPRLAVARADWVHVTYDRRDRRFFESRLGAWDRRAKKITVRGLPYVDSRRDREAMVPSIPPRFRPKGSLRNYYILFDAVWKRSPPVDPILLQPIAWPMCAVLAVWDLTPLERSVLGMQAK